MPVIISRKKIDDKINSIYSHTMKVHEFTNANPKIKNDEGKLVKKKNDIALDIKEKIGSILTHIIILDHVLPSNREKKDESISIKYIDYKELLDSYCNDLELKSQAKSDNEIENYIDDNVAQEFIQIYKKCFGEDLKGSEIFQKQAICLKRCLKTIVNNLTTSGSVNNQEKNDEPSRKKKKTCFLSNQVDQETQTEKNSNSKIIRISKITRGTQTEPQAQACLECLENFIPWRPITF